MFANTPCSISARIQETDFDEVNGHHQKLVSNTDAEMLDILGHGITSGMRDAHNQAVRQLKRLSFGSSIKKDRLGVSVPMHGQPAPANQCQGRPLTVVCLFAPLFCDPISHAQETSCALAMTSQSQCIGYFYVAWPL
jgi:hypothetical protein